MGNKTLWIIIATTSILACGGEEALEISDRPIGDPMVVQTQTAERRLRTENFAASGATEPISRVSPGTKIMGRVEAVPVREGDQVERGQILARLEARDLEASLRQAEAALTMSQVQLDNARKQRERIKSLEARGSATAKNLEDVQGAFRVAEAGLAQAEAALSAAKIHLGHSLIRSPFDGWITAKNIEAGDLANPGVPLFTLEDLSRIRVVVPVPEASVIHLREGSPAHVEILGETQKATVDRIVPSGDPASRTFSVKILLDNPHGRLKSGMYARVSFEGGERQSLWIPSSALTYRGQLEGVFVVGGDDRVTLRWVTTGAKADGETEILSGLEVGDEYVPSPPSSLTDGVRVEKESL